MSKKTLKRISFFLVIWLAFFSVAQSAAQASAAGARLRAGVLGVQGQYGREYLQGASDQLTRILHELDRFHLVERSRLNTIMEEHKLSLSGIIDPSTRSDVGKILGLNIGLMGTIHSLSSSWERDESGGYYEAYSDITVTVVDLNSGEVLGVFRHRGIGTNSQSSVQARQNAIIGALGSEMALEIGKLFPLQGRIVDILNDKVYLSIGGNQGVKEKEYFSVQRPIHTNFAGYGSSEESMFFEEIGLVRVEQVSPVLARADIKKQSVEIESGDYVQELPGYVPTGVKILRTIGSTLAIIGLLALALALYDEEEANRNNRY